ncbi:MAG: DUF3800 domain-containing protein [Bradyrhizobium sp.]|nr:DUF3800 domain-containing protein [Bradyrhizobium sp.]
MRFLYVDESGDPGTWDPKRPPDKRPSQHYILSGLIVKDSDWRNYLLAIVDVRRQLKASYGLPARLELHGAELFRPATAAYKGIKRIVRRAIYRDALTLFAARLTGSRLVNIHLDKANPKYASSSAADIQTLAWSRMLQRFNTELTVNRDLGIVFADDTNEEKIRGLLRKMRVYNPVPSRFGGSYSAPVTSILEDPIIRKSEHSFYIQVADMASHALYRKLYPKPAHKRFNAHRLFDLLGPVLHLPASKSDPQGIVHL